MRTRAVPRLLAATLALTLVAAACGEDDAPTDAGADPSTTEGGEMSDDEGHGDHDDDAMESDAMESDAMDDDAMEGDAHDHGESVEIAADVAPTIEIEVFDDPSGGVNVHVITTDFTIAPELASSEHVEGKGHFHLYVDGERQLRFYNEWIHVPGVTEGDVEISVEVSANDHRAYAVDGVPITASEVFSVPEHSHDEHSHDEAVPVEFEGPAPSLELEVVEDAKKGWNAFVTLDGMTLSPEHASTDHIAGEGHLHILANGQKIGRLYGLATHVSTLPEGDVELTVAAFTNDHQPYQVDGEPIEASAPVTVAS